MVFWIWGPKLNWVLKHLNQGDHIVVNFLYNLEQKLT